MFKFVRIESDIDDDGHVVTREKRDVVIVNPDHIVSITPHVLNEHWSCIEVIDSVVIVVECPIARIFDVLKDKGEAIEIA